MLVTTLAAGLALVASFTTSRLAEARADQVATAVSDGACARTCEVAACVAFEGSALQCDVAPGARINDLHRAGPDPLCVQRCAAGVLPPVPDDIALDRAQLTGR